VLIVDAPDSFIYYVSWHLGVNWRSR